MNLRRTFVAVLFVLSCSALPTHRIIASDEERASDEGREVGRRVDLPKIILPGDTSHGIGVRVGGVRRAGWSDSINGLSAKVEIASDEVTAATEFEARLFVHAQKVAGSQAQLLEGRYVLIMVPVEPNAAAIARSHRFSDSDGIDHTGKVGQALKITAPGKPGQYYLFATIVSTAEDIEQFRAREKSSAEEGWGWKDTLSTPPILVEVVKKRR